MTSAWPDRTRDGNWRHNGGSGHVAELRRRQANDLGAEIAAGLRDRAERFSRDGLAYARLGEQLRRRAGAIERGAKSVIVHGYEVPEATRQALDLSPSAPFVLAPDGRLTAWQASESA